MSRVEVVTVPETTPRALTPRALKRRLEGYTGTVRELLGGAAADLTGETVSVVPDVHYPFHPSTGLVTDPALVGAVVTVLGELTPARVRVVGGGGDVIGRDRSMALLGYDAVLGERECRVVEAETATEERPCHWVGHGEGAVTFSVPRTLLEEPVLAVPSLRPTSGDRVAGAIRTITRAIDPDLPDGAAAAVADLVDPAEALLDATTAFTDRPTDAGLLCCGPARSIDVLATQVLGGDDPVLEAAVSAEDTPEVHGEGSAGLATLPAGRYPADPSPGPAVRWAYRLYASVTGDAVPPQIEP